MRSTPSSRTCRRTLLLGFLFSLSGCVGGGGSSTRGTPAAPTTLTVATADDVKSLDPALAFDTWSTAVVEAFTRRLVDYDAQGNLVLDLADRWDETDGGKTYTFHLREGARF